MKYIDAEKLIAEVERRKKELLRRAAELGTFESDRIGLYDDVELYDGLLAFITSLQQEQPEVDLKTGIELITEERKRQIDVKGFNWRHDDEHYTHQLSDAAIVYAAPAPLRYKVMEWWPWDTSWLKEDKTFTTEGRIRELVKAGALIAAEIDRLQRTMD